MFSIPDRLLMIPQEQIFTNTSSMTLQKHRFSVIFSKVLSHENILIGGTSDRCCYWNTEWLKKFYTILIMIRCELCQFPIIGVLIAESGNYDAFIFKPYFNNYV